MRRWTTADGWLATTWRSRLTSKWCKRALRSLGINSPLWANCRGGVNAPPYAFRSSNAGLRTTQQGLDHAQTSRHRRSAPRTDTKPLEPARVFGEASAARGSAEPLRGSTVGAVQQQRAAVGLPGGYKR